MDLLGGITNMLGGGNGLMSKTDYQLKEFKPSGNSLIDGLNNGIINKTLKLRDVRDLLAAKKIDPATASKYNYAIQHNWSFKGNDPEVQSMNKSAFPAFG